MSKKAQEGGASGFTIVGWILLFVLLVIVILAISGFFNPLLQKLNLLPGGGISAVVTACDGYAQLSSQVDFCTFRAVTINNQQEYVNCADSRVKQAMEAQNQDKFSCLTSYQDDLCSSLIKGGVRNVPKANGVLCRSFSCSDPLIGGAGLSKQCPPTSNPDVKALTKPITVGISNIVDGSGDVCCVAPSA